MALTVPDVNNIVLTNIGKMTTLANALNNPVTADFATSIINPASSTMITGLADVMKA